LRWSGWKCGEALATETQALFQVIMIAEQFGVSQPLLAIDCHVLLQAVTSKPYDSAPLGAMFREIHMRLSLSFIVSKVVY
jgi:hypothetical protein